MPYAEVTRALEQEARRQVPQQGQCHRVGSLREESVKPLRGLLGVQPALVSRQVDIIPLRSGCRPCPCRCWTGVV